MTATICDRCDQLDDPDRERRCLCRRVPEPCTCSACAPDLWRGDRHEPVRRAATRKPTQAQDRERSWAQHERRNSASTPGAYGMDAILTGPAHHDVVLALLRSQPQVLWTPATVALATGLDCVQASCALIQLTASQLVDRLRYRVYRARQAESAKLRRRTA